MSYITFQGKIIIKFSLSRKGGGGVCLAPFTVLTILILDDKNDPTKIIITKAKSSQFLPMNQNIADLEKDRAIIVSLNGQYEFTTDARIAKQHSKLLKNMIEGDLEASKYRVNLPHFDRDHL